MATGWMLLRHRLQQGMLLTLSGTLVSLSGCATGSSASFTQAPLLFAEQTNPSGTATNLVAADPQALAADPQNSAIPARSVGSGGIASLPSGAVTSITRPLSGAVVQLATALPVLVTVNVPAASSVLQSPPLAGLANSVGDTVVAVGSTNTALLQPASAIASPIASVASKPPVMPLPTAVGVAQSVAVTGTSLLTATSATLAKICLLKGCR